MQKRKLFSAVLAFVIISIVFISVGRLDIRSIRPRLYENATPDTNDQRTFESQEQDAQPIPESQQQNGPSVAIIIASQQKDNTTWLHSAFPTWTKHIYITDDPSATNTVPANKGREGMAYLTYMIDHYDSLPDITIFHHAKRYQWHNDDPLYDGLRVLERLRLESVIEQGYANLRCVWTLGCPHEIRPLEEADSESTEDHAGQYYKQAFEELFPERAIPEVVGAPCCAQFAVTADKLRERPRSDYERYRHWLLETDLDDGLSGRVIEYMWHIIFGKPAVHCHDAGECYCKLYGLCDLECSGPGSCSSQYTLAKYSVLPKGWPSVDWDGNPQNASAMR